jgi:steroid delta-isomerase-like uncharacterized protein
MYNSAKIERRSIMSAKQNKAILKRLFSEFNKGNINVIDELFTEDFVDRYPQLGEIPNKEGFKQAFADIRKTFPDWHLSLEDIIAEGEKVAYRFTMQGTDKGGYMGMPATGKKINYTSVGILRFANGKLAERWTLADSMTFMHQLGLV